MLYVEWYLMKKSFPKLGVLVSGRGTNLQSIIHHIQSGDLHAEISVVVSDQPNAYALQRAREANIPSVVVHRDKTLPKESFDRKLIETLQVHGAEWIVLAGFMKILGPVFLAHFPQKVINIHPSLLPKYPGLNAIQSAFENKEKVMGVTVHYVNEGVDTGPVIMQEKVLIDPSDSLEEVESKIHKAEHQIYPKAIQKVLWNK